MPPYQDWNSELGSAAGLAVCEPLVGRISAKSVGQIVSIEASYLSKVAPGSFGTVTLIIALELPAMKQAPKHLSAVGAGATSCSQLLRARAELFASCIAPSMSIMSCALMAAWKTLVSLYYSVQDPADF